MAADTTCPYCKRLTYMELVEGSARIVDADTLRAEAAFQCANCGRFSVGGAEHLGMQRDLHTGAYFQFQINRDSTSSEIERALIRAVEYWEPVEPVGRVYENVPPEISGPADEAHRCASIGAHRASVLMARAVIEAAAKNRGVTSGGLASKIDALAAAGHVRPVVAEAAHAVRMLGNDMAHGDFATADVSAEDTDDVLVLMDEVINDVFAVAARLSKLAARRLPESGGPDTD